jgi:hypothetical protein
MVCFPKVCLVEYREVRSRHEMDMLLWHRDVCFRSNSRIRVWGPSGPSLTQSGNDWHLCAPRRQCSDGPFDMTMFRSMPTPSRFVLWLFLALPVAFGVDAFGYLLPAGALKFDLLVALQISCNLLLGWFFGLIRFRKRIEIGTSILVIIFAFLMPAILLLFAIVSTLFCGIDACGR